ncbi:DMT family transporter [Tepidibacter formicigenes]|jgi:transporter family-2 protein|uniref:Transporter family-2 protein n=1 Tax=Tepidibacter formicigenes DSM 15518 TaxID=1123349 RepID=A0A1M6SER4_9FIRM|nr:DMT family transporter [Tepidibacter formicigenes]SHK43274.1 transporter family-2 protein [Tepidibacter formicigenes DSM 15518]
MNKLLPILFAILVGICTTLEAYINSKLGKFVSPRIATFHNLITGSIFILTVILLKGNIKQYTKIFNVRPQWLIGGLFGACIIYFGIKAIPKLGVANTLIIVFVSQVTTGLFIDIFILRQDQLHLYKLIGIILLFIGTFFVMK